MEDFEQSTTVLYRTLSPHKIIANRPHRKADRQGETRHIVCDTRERYPRPNAAVFVDDELFTMSTAPLVTIEVTAFFEV